MATSQKGRDAYKARKHIVEPVFGWIKSAIGFRGFSLRTLARVSGEFSLMCAAHPEVGW